MTKLRPDGGLQSAVFSVTKNENFRKMMVFGLRSLADLCTPPNPNHLHNALAAVDCGILPVLYRVCSDEAALSNSDIVNFCSKILWGTAEGIQQLPDAVGSDGKKLIANMIREIDLGKCLSHIVQQPTASDATTIFALDAIMGFRNAGFQNISPQVIVPSVFQRIAATTCAPTFPARTRAQETERRKKTVLQKSINLLNVLHDTLNTDEIHVDPATASTVKEIGRETLLAVCSLMQFAESLYRLPLWAGEETTAAIVQGLTLLADVVKTFDIDTETRYKITESVMALADLHHSNSKIDRLSSDIMTVLLQADQIQACLEHLANISSSTEERIRSLKLLRIMSHVDGVAQTIARANATVTLIDAVNAASTLLATQFSSDIVAGATGAVKMLGRVAALSEAAAFDAGKLQGVVAVINCIKRLTTLDPNYLPSVASLVNACCSTCLAFSHNSQRAQQLFESGCCLDVVSLMKSEPSIALEAARALGEWLAAMMDHLFTLMSLPETSVLPHLETISFAGTVFKDNPTHIASCLKAVPPLLANKQKCGEAVTSGVLTLVVHAVRSFPTHMDIALPASRILERLSMAPDAKSRLATNDVIDAQCIIIDGMRNMNDVAHVCATRALEATAQENDISRLVSDIEKILLPENIESLLPTLRALSCVSVIPDLWPACSQYGVFRATLRTMKRLVSSGAEKHRGLDALMRWSLEILQHLMPRGEVHEETSTQIIFELLTIAQSSAVRSIAYQQKNAARAHDRAGENKSHFLVDLLRCVQQLAETPTTLSQFEATQVVEIVTKLLRNFSDDPAVVVATWDLVAVMSRSAGRSFITTVHSSGLLKTTTQLMQRFMTSEMIQAAGLRMWASCLQPSVMELSVNGLKKAGAVEVLNMILSTYPASPEIKAVVPPIKSALLDVNTLDEDLSVTVERLRLATERTDIRMATQALQALETFIPTNTAVRKAIGCGSIRAIVESLTRFARDPTSTDDATEYHAFCAAAVCCLNRLVATRAGATNVSKHCTPIQYNALFSGIFNSSTTRQAQPHPAGLLEFCTMMSILLRHEPNLAEELLRQGIVSKLCTASAESPQLSQEILRLLSHFKIEDLANLSEFNVFFKRVSTLIGELPTDAKDAKYIYIAELSGFLHAVATVETSVRAKRSMVIDTLLGDLIQKHDVIEHLRKTIELHMHGTQEEDQLIVSYAQQCLKELSEIRSLKHLCMMAEGGSMIGTAAKSIRLNQADVNAAEANISLRHQEGDRFERRFATGLNLNDLNTTTMGVHTSRKGLTLAPDVAIATERSVSHSIRAVMLEIIHLMDTVKGRAKFGEWPATLDDHVNHLLLFLDADIEDDHVAFEHTQGCVDALMDAMSKLYVQRVVRSTNIRLLTTVPAMTQKVSRRFLNTFDMPYGACAMIKTALPTYNSMLHESQRGCRTKQFVIGAYRTFSACLYHPDLRPALLEQLDNGLYEKLPATSVALMTRHYTGDMDVVETILEFLSYLVRDPPGAEVFAKKQLRKSPDRFLSLLEQLILKHKANDRLSAQIVEFLERLCENCPDVLSGDIEESAVMKRLLKLPKHSPDSVCAVMRIRARFLRRRNASCDVDVARPRRLSLKKKLSGRPETWEDETVPGIHLEKKDSATMMMLSDSMEQWEVLRGERRLDLDQRVEGILAMVDVADACLDVGEASSLVESNVLSHLVEETCMLLKDYKSDQKAPTSAEEDAGHTSILAALRPVSRVLRRSEDLNSEALMTLRHKLLPQLINDCGVWIASGEAIGLAEVLTELTLMDDGLSLTCPACPGLKEMVEKLMVHCDERPDLLAPDIRIQLEGLRSQLSAIPTEAPNTLRRVYVLWSANPLGTSDMDAPLITQNVDFVFDKTEEYASSCHTDSKSELADELWCGCACMRILHQAQKGLFNCLERREPDIMFSALHLQRLWLLVEGIVETLLDAMTTSSSMARLWVTTCSCDIATIITEVLDRIYHDTTLSFSERELRLLAPLQLAAVVALNNTGGRHALTEHVPCAPARLFYNHTTLMETLLLFWDTWRKKEFSETCLGLTLNVIRGIYNDAWLPICLQNDMPDKLLELLCVEKGHIPEQSQMSLSSIDKRGRLRFWGGSSNAKHHPIVSWSIERDVLFLIGLLAMTPDLRNLMGDKHAVERILKLLKTSLQYTREIDRQTRLLQSNQSFEKSRNFSSFFPRTFSSFATAAFRKSESVLSTSGGAPLQTRPSWIRRQSTCKDLKASTLWEDVKKAQMNGSLALATLNMGHNTNIARFCDSRGITLNIEMLQSSIISSQIDDFDYCVGNGAAALLCNTTYRRTDVQSLYGEQGACEVIMEIIRRYDGSNSAAAMQCLISIMKAIANLALYQANVKTLIAVGIGDTFEHLYRTSEGLSDMALAVSLRTLSNLVMEFEDDAMTVFSVTLDPVLDILGQSNRCNPLMLAMAFDVLGALARQQENAERLFQRHCSSTVLEHLQTAAFHEHMVNYGLRLLVRLGRAIPESVPIIICEGAFRFIISLLDNPAVPPVITCVALRFLLRACRHSEETIAEFVYSGGTAALMVKLQDTVTAIDDNAFVCDERTDAEVQVPQRPQDHVTTVIQLIFWVFAVLLVKGHEQGDDDVVQEEVEETTSHAEEDITTEDSDAASSAENLETTPPPTESLIHSQQPEAGAIVSPTTATTAATLGRSPSMTSDVRVDPHRSLSSLTSLSSCSSNIPPEIESLGHPGDPHASPTGNSTVNGVHRTLASATGRRIIPLLIATAGETTDDPGKKEPLQQPTLDTWTRLDLSPIALGNLCYTATKAILDRTPEPLSAPGASPDMILASLGVAAYVALEGFPECTESFLAAGIVELALRLLRRVKTKRLPPLDNADIARVLSYLITRLGHRGDDHCLAFLCDEQLGLSKAFSDAAKALYDQKAERGFQVYRKKKNLKAMEALEHSGTMCLVTAGLLQGNHSEQFGHTLEQFSQDYPLTLTRYDKDAYPNGVQDLPKPMKEKLRKGGECWAFVLKTGDTLTPVIPRGTVMTNCKVTTVQWRASYDLLRLEWRTNKHVMFGSARPVERLRCITLGVSPMIHATHSMKASRCCLIVFGAAPDSPSGDECTLGFQSSLSCRKFMAMMTRWSQAAETGME